MKIAAIRMASGSLGKSVEKLPIEYSTEKGKTSNNAQNAQRGLRIANKIMTDIGGIIIAQYAPFSSAPANIARVQLRKTAQIPTW